MKKWAIWKTIAVVLAGILFVSGMTVLGVYFGGGFGEKRIFPDAITLTAVDDQLFNPDTNQIEVSSSFQMVVSGQSNTGKPLTDTIVNLTLDGDANDVVSTKTDENGNTYSEYFWDNHVVIVPKQVKIGQVFEVRRSYGKLFNEDGSDYLENGNNCSGYYGGLTTITAEINNKKATAKVAVDTPVFKLEITPTTLGGVEMKHITIDENFTFKTTFFPEASEYLFNDGNNNAIPEAQKRKRLVFFEEDAAPNVSVDFDENNQKYFTAKTLSSGADDNAINNSNEIKAYCFENAADQIERWNYYYQYTGQDLQETYDSMLGYLEDSTTDAAKSASKKFGVVTASVDSFEVEQDGRSLNMTLGNDFTITMQESSIADAFLGAKIMSTDGDELTSMLKNVAIALQYHIPGSTGWHNVNDEILTIVGRGETWPDQSSEEELVYYFPDMPSTNTIFANWKLNSNLDYPIEFRAYVLLLMPEGEGGYTPFSSEDGNPIRYMININGVLNNDQPVSWTNTNEINYTLSYDGQEITPLTIDLEGRTFVPHNNQYQSKKYFVWFSSGVSEQRRKEILGENGDETNANNHIGEYMVGSQSRKLYPVNELTVYDVGEFYLYFATIRTDSNGRDVITGGNLYEIIQMAPESIHVNVTKTLHPNSFTSVQSSISVENAQTVDGTYYIFSGSNARLTFKFAIAEDSDEVVRQKIANDLIDLKLFDEAGNQINNLFTIEPPTVDEDGSWLTFELTVRSTFDDSADHTLRRVTLTDMGQQDISEEQRLEPWNFVHGYANWTFEGEASQTYVFYRPIIVNVTFEVPEDFDIDTTQAIEINQTLTDDENGTSQTITYFEKDAAEPTEFVGNIDDFLEKFVITVFDQHGNDKTLYGQWRYATNNLNAITIKSNGQGVSFPTTRAQQEETAFLWVEGTDGNAVRSDEASQLTFKVTSTGIQKIGYDSTHGFGDPKYADNNYVGTQSPNRESITVAKYGARYSENPENTAANGYGGGKITLANLFKLYLDENKTQPFSQFVIRFDPAYLQSLSDEDVVALFGDDGMIVLYKMDDEQVQFDSINANAIRNKLLEESLTGLHFNHNFMSGEVAPVFKILDKNQLGVVDITLTLQILSSVSFAGPTSFKNFHTAKEQSLGSDDIITISYRKGDEKDDTKTINMTALLSNLNAKIVSSETGYYEIEDQSASNGFGEIVDGNFKFYDNWNANFWTDGVKLFNIVYYFEDGTHNKFAPSFTFNIEVTQNIKFQQKATAVYNFTATQPVDLFGFVDFGRMEPVSEDENAIDVDLDALKEHLNLQIEENNYVELKKSGADWQIVRKQFSNNNFKTPVFEWGKLSFTLQINANMTNSNDSDDGISLGDVDLQLDAGVKYQDVADRFTLAINGKQGTTKACIENYNGVDYLKVTNNTNWYFKGQKEGQQSDNLLFTVMLSYPDNSGDTTKTIEPDYKALYIKTQNGTNATVTFQTKDNAGFFGLEDDKNFLLVQVSTTDGKALLQMCVPIIISRVGLVSGAYSNNNGKYAKIEDLLNTKIDQLIKDGKYLEAKAGNKTLAVAYYYSDENALPKASTKPGIYFFKDQIKTNVIDITVTSVWKAVVQNGQITYVLSDDPNDQTLASVSTSSTEDEKYLSLKHLVGDPANEQDARYVVLRAVITAASMRQELVYVVKVLPDASLSKVETPSVIYPYADDAEYISQEIGKTYTQNLDAAFGAEVGQEKAGMHRFNIFVGDENVGANLDYAVTHSNPIVTTKDGQAAPDGAMDVQIVGREIQITPKQVGTFVITFTRSYTDIVGGEIEYKFILNDEGSEYSLQFESADDTVSQMPHDDGLDQDGIQTYSITLKKQSEENDHFDLKVNYIYTSGDPDSSTHNLVQYELLKVLGDAKLFGTADDLNGKNAGVDYYATFAYENCSQEKIDADNANSDKKLHHTLNSNILRINFVDYLDSDKEATLYFYSMYGLVAKLNIKFEGSVEVTFVEDTIENGINAGQTINVIDEGTGLFNEPTMFGNHMTFKNATAPEERTLAEKDEENGKTISYEWGIKSVKESSNEWYFNDTFTDLTIRPSIKDYNVSLTFTLWIVKYIDVEVQGEPETSIVQKQVGEPLSYTFIVDFKVNASVFNAGGGKISETTNESSSDINTIERKTGVIYAGDSVHDIVISELANGLNSNSLTNLGTTVKYQWKAISDSDAIASASTDWTEQEKFSIITNQVAGERNPIMLISVGLFADGETMPYQQFFVKYTFTVMPSVTIKPNYPVPAAEELEVEYIENEKTLSGLDFITGKAPFATTQRFVIKDAKDKTEIFKDDYSNATVTLYSISNATLSDENGNLSTETGNNIIYKGDNAVNKSKQLTFHFGEPNEEDGYVDKGGSAKVTVQISYNNVVAYYNFEIVNTLYGLQINRATNRVDNVGNTETFYVDELTESVNIFEKDRMLSMHLSDAARVELSTSTQIYILLEHYDDGLYSYDLQTITLSAEDAGKEINIDWGKSFAGWTIVGAYREEPINSNSIVEYQGTTDQFEPTTENIQDILFDNLRLASRVELTYNSIVVDYDKTKGENGLKVTKDDTTKQLSEYSIQEMATGADNTQKLTFSYGTETNLGTYSYMLDIDMDVREAVVFEEKSGTLEVNQTQTRYTEIETASESVSLINKFGVYKPSVGLSGLFGQNDFDDTHTIRLSVVGLDKDVVVGDKISPDDANDERAAEKLEALTNFTPNGETNSLGTDLLKPYYNGIKTNNYLDISAVSHDENDEIYIDYNVDALGAGNNGNFALLKLEYTVSVQFVGESAATPFTKTFYMIVKIVPDYEISYKGASGVDPVDNIYSNESENEIYSVSALENNDVYTAIDIAGRGDTAVVVHHKNAKVVTNVSAQEFNYDLQTGKDRHGVSFNEPLNVSKKLAYEGGPLAGWTPPLKSDDKEGTYTWQSTQAENAKLTLSGAKKVVFGSQLYCLQATNRYGYTFYFCFKLVGGPEPDLQEGLVLHEDFDFDVGIEYNTLQLDQEGEEGDYQYIVSGGDLQPTSPKDGGFSSVDRLILNNMDVWGFDKPLTGDLTENNYREYFKDPFEGGTWVDNFKEGSLTSGQDIYFKPNDFLKLRVMSVSFYQNGELLATSSKLESDPKLKTSDEVYFVTSEDAGTNLEQGLNLELNKFHLSRLNSSIYGANQSAEIDVEIKLGYLGDTPESGYYDEVYNLRSKVTVSRNLATISANNNVVRDGVDFDVADKIEVRTRKQSGTNSSPIVIPSNAYAIFDDTLEILVPGVSTRSSVRYNIEIDNSKDEKGQAIINDESENHQTEKDVASNEFEFDRVEYRSISGIFGTTLSKDYAFRITVDKSQDADYEWPKGTKFFYNGTQIAGWTQNDGDFEMMAEKTVSLEKISTDKIEIADSRTLSDNKVYNVSQYYLISVNQEILNNELDDEFNDYDGTSTTVEYRHEQKFIVTGHYYSLKYNYAGERKIVDDYFTVEKDGKTQYVIPLEAWTSGMTLNELAIDSNGLENDEKVVATFDQSMFYNETNENGYLYIEYTVGSDGAGGGSGAVTYDSKTGAFITTDAFNINSHYISVVIKQRVSRKGIDSKHDFALTNEKGSIAFRLKAESENEQIDITSLFDSKKSLTYTNRYVDEGKFVYKTNEISFDLQEGETVKAFARKTTLKSGENAKFEEDKVTVSLQIDGATTKNFIFSGSSDDVAQTSGDEQGHLAKDFDEVSIKAESIEEVVSNKEQFGLASVGEAEFVERSGFYLVTNTDGLSFLIKSDGSGNFVFYSIFSNFAFQAPEE